MASAPVAVLITKAVIPINVQSIWTGEEYAYCPNKGNYFVMNAIRGKCVRVEKSRPTHGERAKSYVSFESENGVRRVRARDVINFWADYEREREAYLKEREERSAKHEAKRQEFLAGLAAKRAEATTAQAHFQTAFLNETGIPSAALISIDNIYVTLDCSLLAMWLTAKANGSDTV